MSVIYLSIGGTALTGAEAPYPYPTPIRSRRTETAMMRPGSAAPGRRVVSDLGAADSHCDLEFESRRITAAHIATFRALWEAWPPAAVTVEITDDTGTISYSCAWAEGGFQPERTTYDANLWRCKFKFHVLEVL